VAAFCTTISYFPQLKKCWDTGSAGDLSFRMFYILVAGIALWVAYGWLQSDSVIIVANTVSLMLLTGILWFKLRERRTPRGAVRARPSSQSFAEGNAVSRGKPTFPPPSTTGLSSTLDRNIRALRQRRLREESSLCLLNGRANKARYTMVGLHDLFSADRAPTLGLGEGFRQRVTVGRRRNLTPQIQRQSHCCPTRSRDEKGREGDQAWCGYLQTGRQALHA
jgi:MtN3 and saliva related transmembrane protein